MRSSRRASDSECSSFPPAERATCRPWHCRALLGERGAQSPFVLSVHACSHPKLTPCSAVSPSFFCASSRHGFIVAVTDVLKISDGLVLAARGEVLFHVSYRAVLFRPVKDEVVDAIVKTVAKVRRSPALRSCPARGAKLTLLLLLLLHNRVPLAPRSPASSSTLGPSTSSSLKG